MRQDNMYVRRLVKTNWISPPVGIYVKRISNAENIYFSCVINIQAIGNSYEIYKVNKVILS